MGSVDSIEKDWQQTQDTVEQRDQYILDSDQWTDFTFIVGEPGHEKKFKVHRLHLAKTSSVFARMLYGSMKSENDEECVTDIDPEVFNLLLQYIYKGTIVLDNYDLALGLLYASIKYMMPDSLLVQCREYIEKNLNPETVWSALDFALLHDESSIRKRAIKIIESQTEVSLQVQGLLEVSSRPMIKLAQIKALTSTSECKIYEAIVRWAKKKLSLISSESTTLRSILDPVLPYIRFLAMPNEDFWKCVDYGNILNDKEILHLAKCINFCNDSFPPEGFSNVQEKRKYKCNTTILSEDGSTFDVDGTDHSLLGTVSDWNAYKFCKYAYLYLSINSNISINYLKMPSQIRPVNASSNNYVEHVTFLVHNKLNGKVSQICIKQTLQYGGHINSWGVSQLGYYSQRAVDELEIRVVFHVTGTYPCHNDLVPNVENEAVTRKFLGI